MAISSVGLGSGINVTDTVAKLVAFEQRPIQALQTKAAAMNSQVSAYSQLKSQISNLQTQVDKLTAANTWQARTLTSSNTAVVTGTASSTAAHGTFDVKVKEIASAQTIGSGVLDPKASLGECTLTINLGEWVRDDADPVDPNDPDDKPTLPLVFKPNAGGGVPVVITAEDNTPAKVAAKINAANAGVTAIVLNDHNGDRLTLQSTATGANAGFTVAVAKDAAEPGLKRLEYLGVDSSAAMTLSQKAQDTQATINGIAMSSRNLTFAKIA